MHISYMKITLFSVNILFLAEFFFSCDLAPFFIRFGKGTRLLIDGEKGQLILRSIK